jgi:hypothetical protein
VTTQTRPNETRTNGSGASQASEADRAQRLIADTEDRMEDWGERAGRWASRAAARAREELEDIWAEAQTIRRGD